MATKRIEIPNRYTNTCQWAGDIEDTGSAHRNLGAAIKAALLTGADLTGADLRGAVLRGAVLRDAILKDADLTGAVLRDAILRDADLTGADLTGAFLRDADLTGAVLRGADLTGAILTGAILRGADLTGAILTGAVKISALRAMSGLYQYQTWAFTADSGVPWVRMGCLWKSVEEWDWIGIRASNPVEFPNDGSAKCEERVRAFEFVRDMALRMAEEWKVENQKKEE